MKRYLNVNLPKSMKELEIAMRKMAATRIIGHYQSIFKGKGLEFDQYREYMPIDDASSIDWKASARANQLLVKEYVEERDVKIFFLIDVSNSMVFGSTPKLKNEYALELSAALANLILSSGDRVGFALFNDKVIKLSLPGTGRRQLYTLTSSLLDPEIYGGGYDLDKVLRFAANYLSSSISLLIIISGFMGQRNWEKSLKIVGRKFDTIGIMISDPRDRTLPQQAGQIVVADPYSNKTLLVDPSLIKEKYEKYSAEMLRRIKITFEQAGADFLMLPTEKSFVVPLINFFKERSRKWR